MKIFLHIGHHKTGTSNFQRTCERFRDELFKAGIHYPRGGDRAGHQHWQILKPLFSGEGSVSQIDGLNTPCETLILSSENLVTLDRPACQRLVESLKQQGEVHILYTIRNWTDFLPSRFVQGIRRGDGWSWPDMLEACPKFFKWNHNYNFGFILENYLATSSDGFHLFDYDRGRLNKSLFELTGVEPTLSGNADYEALCQTDHNARLRKMKPVSCVFVI